MLGRIQDRIRNLSVTGLEIHDVPASPANNNKRHPLLPQSAHAHPPSDAEEHHPPSPSPRSPGRRSPYPSARAFAASAMRHLSAPPLALVSNASSDMTNNSAHSTSSGADLARDALESQVRQRDRRIASLERDLQLLDNQLQDMQKEHMALRRAHLESNHRHSVACLLWRRTNDGLKARVECFQQETTPEAAQEIAALIRDAAPANKDSAYLMTLQEQLQKATVKMDHLASQTEVILHKGEEVVESLREEMNEVIKERSLTETEMMDQKDELQEEKKLMLENYDKEMYRLEGAIKFLEKKAAKAWNEQDKDQGSDHDEKEEGKSADDAKDDLVKDGESRINNEKEESNSSNSNLNNDKSEDNNSECAQDKPNSGQQPVNEGGDDEDSRTPEELRHELRKLSMEKERRLGDLRMTIRKKNDEFSSLMRIKESMETTIKKMIKENESMEGQEKDSMEDDGETTRNQ